MDQVRLLALVLLGGSAVASNEDGMAWHLAGKDQKGQWCNEVCGKLQPAQTCVNTTQVPSSYDELLKIASEQQPPVTCGSHQHRIRLGTVFEGQPVLLS